ncbi:G4 quadruplex nucleic acid binding protein [Lambiella insularis]|nr:G4 quadruplex nucleic acid binding protein [Lambiella insularis]
MSTHSGQPTSPVDIIKRFFPSSSSTPDSDISELSQSRYPDTHYTDNEKVEISQWVTTSERLASQDEDQAKHAERLGSLNIHLSSRTTLLGHKPSIADAVLFARLAPAVKTWSSEERTGERGYHHIVRYIDFVQSAPLFGLSIPQDEKIAIDPSDVRFVHKPLDSKEEKERKKKEKALASASIGENQIPLVVDQGNPEQGGKAKKENTNNGVAGKGSPGAVVTDSTPAQPKREKKEKAPKQLKAPVKETLLSPCLIDLRVGHILQAIPHPNADSLYVSTIACGDPAGTENTSVHTDGQVVRTVCSGLSGLVPLADMQDRKVVAVCNLKPVTMRGVKSAAMVLAASPRLAPGEVDHHTGPVELVNPPDGAQAGDRIYFEGWEGEPEGVLNPKKKVWETLQPGFTTTDTLGVAFDAEVIEQLKGIGTQGLGRLVAKSGGECKVISLKGAVVR